MTSSEDAVSGAIGGVLLIALVLIGAAIVGTFVTSQPLPEKIPKVQFSVKDVDTNGDGIGDELVLEHEGGESLKKSAFRVRVGSTLLTPGDPNCTIRDGIDEVNRWSMGDRIIITGQPGMESVGLVYTEGSGGTLLRSVYSPGGFDYVFPAPDPDEVVDVPAPYPTAGPFGDLAWQFPSTGDPQPTFAPIDKNLRVFVAATDHTMAVPANVTKVFDCGIDGDGDDLREIIDAIAEAQGGVVELSDGNFRGSGQITLGASNTTLIGQGSLSTTLEITSKGGSNYL
ncbi:MAG TPA: type IV pilin, partial [Methanoregulaceae archaeon]|nr:type IV pilin [Methanoregulaceae archaeon]